MATTKVTFTLDAPTLARLNQAAERTSRPKSEIVRDAITEYYDRMGRLSERERVEMLAKIDQVMRTPPTRSPIEVKKELRGIKAGRKSWGRE